MLGVTDELVALAHSPGNVQSYRLALRALWEIHPVYKVAAPGP